MPIIAHAEKRRRRCLTLAAALRQMAEAKIPVRSVCIKNDGSLEFVVGDPANPDHEMTVEDLRKLL
jgi:hypothetical protein